jgi:hypothetical protein
LFIHNLSFCGLLGIAGTTTQYSRGLQVCEGRAARMESQEPTEQSSGPTIELGDLTTGPDAEINRLRSSMLTLLGEMSEIRRQHAVLLSDHQKLTGELREIKLVLAKVHAKELSTIEWQRTWTEWLRKLSDFFQSDHGRSRAAGNNTRRRR